MKRLFVAALTLAASVSVAAQENPKYGVVVTPEKNVDYSALHSYVWTRGQPSPVKAIDAQIVAAIDRELASLGMTKASSGPADVVVSYASLTRTDTNLKGKADSKGLLPHYPVGTLVVAFSEPASTRRLLRMRVDVPIETQGDQLEASINRAVALMFAEYPTRRRK
jgi:uncharacterized protein DUF4136